jgi:hypothetical protein
LLSGFWAFVHRPYPEASHKLVWSKKYNIWTASDMVETDKGPYGNVMPDGRKRLLWQGTQKTNGDINDGTVYNFRGYVDGNSATNSLIHIDDWDGSTAWMVVNGENPIKSGTFIQFKESIKGIHCTLYARSKRWLYTPPYTAITNEDFEGIEWTEVYSHKKTDFKEGALRFSLPSEWFCCGVTGVDIKSEICNNDICHGNEAVQQFEGDGQASWVTNSTAFSNEPKCIVHGQANISLTYIGITGGVQSVMSKVEYVENCIFASTQCTQNAQYNVEYSQKALGFGNDANCGCTTYEDPFHQGTYSQFKIDYFLSDYNEKDGKIVLTGVWENTLETFVSIFNYDEYYTYWVATDRTQVVDPRTEYKKGTVTITRLV